MWFYPNFRALFGISLLPYLWYTTTFFLVTTHWQEVFHWSALKCKPVTSTEKMVLTSVISWSSLLAHWHSVLAIDYPRWLHLSGSQAQISHSCWWCLLHRLNRFGSLHWFIILREPLLAICIPWLCPWNGRCYPRLLWSFVSYGL
jgi:hypothetical protein